MADSINVLIAFYSRSGVTEALAKALAEGVTEAGGTPVLRRAREVVSREVMQQAKGWAESADEMNAKYEAPTAADAVAADAILLGSPTRFGVVSSELKAYLDSLGGLWFQGKLVNKIGAAFSSTSTPHGGNEGTIHSMLVPMMHFGMILVPPGYADPSTFEAGSPYGVTAVSGQNAKLPSEKEQAVARHQGRRVVEITRAVKAGMVQA